MMHSDNQVWAVEAWRALAAWLVVWAHWAGPLGLAPYWSAYAFVGVDLFFVISGFVFAPLLVRGVPSLADYALRRLMRIYPAYVVSLGVYLALALADARPWLYVLEHLLMAHVQSREMAFYYNPAFWSLPSEMEFYLTLPLLAWAWQRLGGAAGRVAAVLLVVLVGLRLGLLAMADGQTQNTPYILLHHLPGLACEFGLGMLSWHWAQDLRTSRQRWLAGAGGWLGMAMTVVLYRWMQDQAPDWRNGQLGAATAACFAWVLACSAHWRPRSKLLMQLGWWGGRLSYGVYLLHMAWLPLGLAVQGIAGPWAGLALAGLGTVISATLLHALVEDPARRWAKKVTAARRAHQNTSVSPG